MKKPPKRRPVKPEVVKSDKVFNMHNPQFNEKIEEAFKCGPTQYYSFKKDTIMPYGRYLILQGILQEVNFRMSLDTLKSYLKKLDEELNGTKGAVNIGNALVYIGHMKNLTELAFEPETVYRLASCLFFDEREDLTTWDKKHNEAKIRAWRDNGTLGFFYNKLFQEFINLKNTSETDIQDYLDRVGVYVKTHASAIQMQ